MREIRTSGSEEGAAQINALPLPYQCSQGFLDAPVSSTGQADQVRPDGPRHFLEGPYG